MFMTVKQAAEKWGIFTGSLSLLVTKTVIFNRVIFGEKYMKKVAFLLICTMLLCSCNNSTTPASTSETEEITSSVSETTEATAVTTAASTTTAIENKLENPIQSEFIDENGYLTEEFSKRVQLFIDNYVDRTASGVILTLQDFDFDNVPEIVYTAHDGGRGEQESKVYRAGDFHYYGSFNGFCRDGKI